MSRGSGLPPLRSQAYDGCPSETLAAAWDVPRVETWARVGSTNDRALALAVAGAAPGTTVVADEQTAGRGRRGAAWRSAPGCGLWMSVVLEPTAGDPRLPLLVGVACAEGIEAVADDVEVEVKWPNDLLIGARKVGGILVERVSGTVVVGIGINVRLPAEGFASELATRATVLEVESGKRLARSELAGQVLAVLTARLAAAAPFEQALRALTGRDALLDRAVSTEDKGDGVARGVDASGALVLERADGSRVRVVSGSVRPARDGPAAASETPRSRPAGRVD